VRVWPAITLTLTLLAAAGPVSATQVCAWMDEAAKPDDLRELKLWLQSDGEVDFLYEMAGDGLVSEGNRSHSPSSGTFVLHPGQPDSPWGFGATLSPPGRIDVIVRLHAPTPSIFDPPGPVMAEYTFRRAVAEGETAVPPVLAAKQCKTLTNQPQAH
jgi:hypothetical protein